MTDLVKLLKIGNNSYSILDNKATPFLSNTDKITLLANGTYRGAAVANHTIFTGSDGVLNELQYSSPYVTTTWTSGTITNGKYIDLVYAKGNLIATSFNNNSIYISTNNGATWTENTSVGSKANKMAVDEFGNVYSFTEAYRGIKSTDGGLTWTKGTANNCLYNCKNIAYGNGKWVACGTLSFYSGTRYGQGYSSDGLTYTAGNLLDVMGSNHIASVIYDPSYDRFVARSDRSNIICVSSTGQSWTAIGNTPAYTDYDYEAMCAGEGVLLFCIYSTKTCYRSTDGGATWTTLPALPVTSTWVHLKYFNGAFYVISKAGTIYLSYDNGDTWTKASASQSYSSMHPYMKDANTVYMYPRWGGTGSNSNFYTGAIYETHNHILKPISCTTSEVNTALAAKQDVLTAGTGISITTETETILSPRLTTVGNPSISNTGDASDFSDSNYFTMDNPFTESPNTFDIVFAITPNAVPTDNEGIFDGGSSALRFTRSDTNSIRLRAPDGVDIVGTTTLTSGTKYWAKASFNVNAGWTLSLSTNGTTWNTEATSTTKTKVGTGTQVYRIGDNTATNAYLNATMHLADSYINIGGTKTFFADLDKDVVISNNNVWLTGNTDPTPDTEALIGQRYFNRTTGDSFVNSLTVISPEVKQYTEVGTCVISDDMIYTNSSGNRLTFSRYTGTINSFEVVIRAKTPSSFSGTNKPVLGQVTTNKTTPQIDVLGGSSTFEFGLPTSGGSWGTFVKSGSVQTDTWYWIRGTWNGSTIKIEHSLDGVTWITGGSAPQSAAAWTENACLGADQTSDYWNSDIDLNNCYIKINGELFWKAYTPGVYQGEWIKLQKSIPVLESLPEEPVEGQIYFITGSS